MAATESNVSGGTRGYEFNDYQNLVLTDAHKAMSFVGIYYAVVGGLYLLVMALLGEYLAKHGVKIGGAGALFLLVVFLDSACIFGSGVLTKLAANRLREVVQTAGNDVPSMMRALGNLRGMYWMYVVTLVVDLGTDVLEVVGK